MDETRRATLLTLLASVMTAEQRQEPDDPQRPRLGVPEEDQKLPSGKSQKDAISKKEHEDALKEVEKLIGIAEDLRTELRRAGNYVVSVSSLKKTEDIEKLARQIRGKLKA